MKRVSFKGKLIYLGYTDYTDDGEPVPGSRGVAIVADGADDLEALFGFRDELGKVQAITIEVAS